MSKLAEATISIDKKVVGPAQTITETLLNDLRRQGDAPADNFLFPLFDTLGREEASELFNALAQSAKPIPDEFRFHFDEFVHQQVHIPQWADEKLLQKASTLFLKQWYNIQVMLGCYSLPYCYLAADGVKVLYQSKRLRTDASKRLQETDDFLLRVVHPDAFKRELELKRTVSKIRLLHSATRYFILKHGSWDIDTLGYPVNQEDMAGTNLAFSYIALRGLRKMKIAVDAADAEAYLHLWNVIGYMLGLKEELLPANVRVAQQLDEKIAKRHFRSSEEAKELTGVLIKAIQKNVPPAQRRFIPGYIRYLLGEENALSLGLEKAEQIKPFVMMLKIGNQIDALLGKDLSKKRPPQPVERFHW